MPLRIFVAGDVVPVNRTIDLFKEKQTETIFGNIISEIKNSDVSIVNLECPIVDGEAVKIKKCGPALRTSRETIEVLREAGFNYLTLSNNHFFDFGQKGVSDTMDACEKVGILTIGGGKTLAKARKIEYFKKNDITVALINACEHEFSVADESHGGSNPLDIIQMDEDILAANQKADYVVLILHGGIEHYQYPSPWMKRSYRHFIDMGADIIINHHQHCFSGYEVYKEKYIFYGLGNFCFDSLWKQSLPQWKYGYAVRLTLEEKISVELIPYEQCGEFPTIILRSKDVFEQEIDKINVTIANDYILNQKFSDYVLNREYGILQAIIPFRSKIIRSLFSRGFLGKIYNKTQILNIKNKLCCESHYEVLKHYFNILSK